MHLFTLFSLKCCRIVVYIFAMCLCPCLDDFLDSERGFLAQLHLLPQWKSQKAPATLVAWRTWLHTNVPTSQHSQTRGLPTIHCNTDVTSENLLWMSNSYFKITLLELCGPEIIFNHSMIQKYEIKTHFITVVFRPVSGLYFPHSLTHLMWWHWTRHWTYDWSPWGFSPQVQRVEIWIPSTQTCFGLCASSEPPGRFWFTHLQQTHPAG